VRSLTAAAVDSRLAIDCRHCRVDADGEFTPCDGQSVGRCGRPSRLSAAAGAAADAAGTPRLMRSASEIRRVTAAVVTASVLLLISIIVDRLRTATRLSPA